MPKRKPWSDRGSRHERGYGAEWDRLRLEIMWRDQGICRCAECVRLGRLRPAHDVDHVLPKAQGGTDDPANLVAINRECHREKSLRERGMKVRPKIGADGYPVEVK